MTYKQDPVDENPYLVYAPAPDILYEPVDDNDADDDDDDGGLG